MKLRFSCFSLGICFVCLLSAQENPLLLMEVQKLNILESDGSELSLHRTGGLYSPQFQQMDLDGDGLEEIVIFDRRTEELTVLTKDVNEDRYLYSEEMSGWFPDIKHWFSLIDFNNDGTKDILTASYDYPQQGIKLYLGSKDSDKVRFELVQPHRDFASPVLSYTSESSGQLHIYVSFSDNPLFADIDSDGDIDVLTFDPGGSYVYWYENISTPDSTGIEYILTDRCWGRFFETGNSSDIVLTQDGGCPDLSQSLGSSRAPLHAGSTLSALDVDQDGDLDLLLGDLSYDYVVLLENGAAQGLPYFVSSEVNFPTGDTSARVSMFPLVSILDAPSSAVSDVVISPNRFADRDDQSIHYYENNGDGTFHLRTKNWLAQEMFDYGSRSASVSYAIDGTVDMGMLFFFRNENEVHFGRARRTDGRLQVLSVSTSPGAERPAWLDEYSGAYPSEVVKLENGQPGFALGLSDGTIKLCQLNTQNGQFDIYRSLDMDVGFDATPTFVDYDGDGDLDMVVGELNGNLNYFENQGDSTQWVFSSIPEEPLFGKVDTRRRGFFEGYSYPRFWRDTDGETFLLSGSASGDILLYGVVHDDAGAMFPLLSSSLLGAYKPRESTLDLFYSHASSYLQVGNLGGGYRFYTIEPKEATALIGIADKSDELIVFPNPVVSGSSIQLSLPVDGMDIVGMHLYNSLGRAVSTSSLDSPQKGSSIQLPVLSAGTYVLRLTLSSGGIVTKRIVVL